MRRLHFLTNFCSLVLLTAISNAGCQIKPPLSPIQTANLEFAKTLYNKFGVLFTSDTSSEWLVNGVTLVVTFKLKNNCRSKDNIYHGNIIIYEVNNDILTQLSDKKPLNFENSFTREYFKSDGKLKQNTIYSPFFINSYQQVSWKYFSKLF